MIKSKIDKFVPVVNRGPLPRYDILYVRDRKKVTAPINKIMYFAETDALFYVCNLFTFISQCGH